MKSPSQIGLTDDFVMFGPNPPDVTAGLQYDVNRPLVFNGRAYVGLGVVYEAPNPGVPTPVTLVLIGTQHTVSGIVTTKIDGQPVNVPWTHQGKNWTYPISTDLFSQNHQIDFTVTWSDGTRHDPKIIINPTSQ